MVRDDGCEWQEVDLRTLQTAEQRMKGSEMSEMESIAQALVARGKGILAADESTPTIAKRFEPIGVASTEETRRAYREALFTTPGLRDFISGVILFDETDRKSTRL